MKTVAIQLVRVYQKWISPMFPARCKYYPSCSSYAITAISTYGLKGFAMAVWRLVRCNPWSYGGVDYVPKKISKNINKISYTSGGATR